MKLTYERYLKYIKILILTLLAIYLLMITVNFSTWFFKFVFSLLRNIIEILSPIIIGIFVAILLNPITEFYEKLYYKIKKNKRKNNKRLVGTFLTIITIIIIIVIIIFVIIKKFNIQEKGIEGTVEIISININKVTSKYLNIEESLLENKSYIYISKFVDIIINKIQEKINLLSNKFITGVSITGEKLVSILIGVVISYYLLIDKKFFETKLKKTADIFFPKKVNLFIYNFCKKFYKIFSSYIKIQLIDIIIMTILITVFLKILKMDFALTLGILISILNIIPFIGAFIGIGLAVSIAILTLGVDKGIYTLIGLLILIQIDSLYILPKICGKIIKISSLEVILSIIIFGKLFGVIGMIFAIPTTTIIKEYAENYFKKKKI